jgi:hypothetical protein
MLPLAHGLSVHRVLRGCAVREMHGGLTLLWHISAVSTACFPFAAEGHGRC